MKDLDQKLILGLLTLLGLGLVQVYSSSYIFAVENFNNGLHFFFKQSFAVLLGIFVLLVSARLPWAYWEKIFLVLWGLTGLAIIATLIPGLGVKVGGARRWLNLGFFRFEPSELLRVLVPWLFSFLYRHWDEVGHWSKRPHAWLMWLSPVGLLLLQPDFGGFSIILLVVLMLLFLVGFSWRYFLWLAGILLPVLGFLIIKTPYRLARVVAFLNPWADPSNSGFQLIQSLLTVRNGGLTGQGIGAGQGKLFFLPEAHTDFTLAVFAEEMGFIGIMVLFLIYAFIFIKTLRMAQRVLTNDKKIFVFGAAILFGLNTLFNMAVVLGLLPTKGLALPFMSYGGSSLLCYCLLFGWVLNLDRQATLESNYPTL